MGLNEPDKQAHQSSIWSNYTGKKANFTCFKLSLSFFFFGLNYPICFVFFPCHALLLARVISH